MHKRKQYRACIKCGIAQPIKNFDWHTKSKGYRRRACRPCTRAERIKVQAKKRAAKKAKDKQLSFPGSQLTDQERLWVELIIHSGFTHKDATAKAFPHIKNTWQKCHKLKAKPKIQAYINHCMAESRQEPDRILRKALKAVESVLKNPYHKQFANVLNTIARLSGRLDHIEKPQDVNVKIQIEYEND